MIAKLCFAMKPYKALKNDYIYREGEVCREFFIIEEGHVELSRYEVLLANLTKGSAFGEDALYGGRKRERSALALSDCGECLSAFCHPHTCSRRVVIYPQRTTCLRGRRLSRSRLADLPLPPSLSPPRLLLL